MSIGHRKITACLASIRKGVYRQTKRFTSAFIQRTEIGCAEKFFLKGWKKAPTLTWISDSFFQGEQLGTFARVIPFATYPAISLNVTERKQADEERERLRQVQADLAHLTRVTTMGELTASLAHKIRQPISAAVTNAKTCLRWLGRDEPNVAEAREAASRIVNDVTRAADIIGRISTLFKKGGLQRRWWM